MKNDLHATDIVEMTEAEVELLDPADKAVAETVREAHEERIDNAARARRAWPVAMK